MTARTSSNVDVHGRWTTHVPSASTLQTRDGPGNYSECFQIRVRAGSVCSDDMVCAFFGATPGWFAHLARLRDRLVAPLGLKTLGDSPHSVAPPFVLGQRLGFFQIQELVKREAVLGNEDRHLDFRVSLLATSDGGDTVVSLSTWVGTKNRLGRAYFFVVKPFHRLLVPLMARRIVTLLERCAAATRPT